MSLKSFNFVLGLLLLSTSAHAGQSCVDFTGVYSIYDDSCPVANGESALRFPIDNGELPLTEGRNFKIEQTGCEKLKISVPTSEDKPGEFSLSGELTIVSQEPRKNIDEGLETINVIKDARWIIHEKVVKDEVQCPGLSPFFGNCAKYNTYETWTLRKINDRHLGIGYYGESRRKRKFLRDKKTVVETGCTFREALYLDR